MHYGFADDRETSHDQALVNQYKYVIGKAGINERTRALDAGCGVGGASLYIAKQTGASVVGLTLVQKQVEEAQASARRDGVDNKTNFLLADYCSSGLPDESFDVIFGIESICYTTPKRDFLIEAYRLLKPGGRLIVTDGYCKREPRNIEEQNILKKFCEGWRLLRLDTFEVMSKQIKEVGFANLVVEDMTEKVSLSLFKMRQILWWWSKVEWIVRRWKIPVIEMARENAKSMRASIVGVESGLFGYYAHFGVKPRK